VKGFGVQAPSLGPIDNLKNQRLIVNMPLIRFAESARIAMSMD
jgi:hypothetical protein